jgi:hypothetical protein
MRSVKYRHFNAHRRFGIELEVGRELSMKKLHAAVSNIVPAWATESFSLSTGEYWHIKTDSTCGADSRGNPCLGFEVASYVGDCLNDLLIMEMVAHELKLAGAVANHNCGFHVHADASDFYPAQIGILAAWWVKIEWTLLMALPMRRFANTFCKMLGTQKPINRTKKYDALEFLDLVKPKNLDVHGNLERRFTLNLVN